MLALATTVVSCHEPDAVESLMSGVGLNSVTAQFSTGDYKNEATAKFTTVVDDSNIENIVIDVPYFYPETSENITSMEAMRVVASLDNNYSLSPALSTLDLTEENYFTLTCPDGTTRNVMITGNHKKSSACDILSFSIPEASLTGIINQTSKTISLISIDAVTDASATVTLSPKATISPDPATLRDYSTEPTVFTVTAYDGVTTAEYEVITQVPNKVAYGIRTGSANELWMRNFTNTGLDITIASSDNYTVGVLGDDIIVSNGTKLYQVGVISGEKVKELDWSSVSLNGSGAITSDGGGNLLMCSFTAAGNTFSIWSTSSIDEEPTLLTSYVYPGSSRGDIMGKKLSVFGDINGDAVITVPTWLYWGPTGSYDFVRWIVEDGVVGEAEIISPTGSTLTQNWTGSVDVSYATTDMTTGNYFMIASQANVLESFPAATNAVGATLTTPTWGANDNFNNVGTVSFNNATYVATYGGCFFTYSQMLAYMQDVTTLSSFSGTIQDSASCVWTSNQYGSNANATFYSSDLVLAPTSDGFTLRLVYIDGSISNGALVCWEFDCIDQ